MSPIISIVIPIYNSSTYLASCLESLIMQTEKNWEAILVDDGSDDGSNKICADFSSRDSRFRLVSQTNRGTSSARNIGLALARGKWISFVDADDCLPEYALKTLFHYASKAECDLVIGGYEKYDLDNNKSYWIDDRVIDLLDRDAALALMYKARYYSYLGFAWGKLFRASLIRQYGLIFNPAIYFNEDRLFVTQFLSHSNTILLLTEPVYHYYERETSAMSSLKKGFNAKFITDLDGFIGMKKAVLSAGNSKELVRLADEGIASSYWRIRRMMRQFHVSSMRQAVSLQKRVIESVTPHSYFLYIIKPFFGNILREVGILRPKR